MGRDWVLVCDFGQSGLILTMERQLVDSIGFLGAKFQSGRPAGPTLQF